MILKLVNLFQDETLGTQAATSLGIVAEDGDRVLSKENFAVIRVSRTARVSRFHC